MTPRTVLLIASFTALVAFGCSRDEGAAPTAPGGGAAPAADSLAKIPILPDYKYYAGGPVMKRDPYGRYRLADFAGEVQQPPSRGMIFGAKRDGDKLEYKVWGNGVLLGVHRGYMKHGVYWEEYAESYRQGKLVAREKTVNDDEIKRSKLITEDIDPETGEVIRTKEASLSYLPPAIKFDDVDEDDEDEEEGADTAPAAAAPAGKDAAPAPAAPANADSAPAAPAAPKDEAR